MVWPFSKKEVKTDGFVNKTTGLGYSALDKLIQTKFEQNLLIDDHTLENLFHDNDMAAKIASIFPNEMTRKGFHINIGKFGEKVENADQVKAQIMTKLNNLRTLDKLNEALVWSRVFGGCAVILGVDDGRNARLPVNEEKIKSIRFLNILDKRYVRPLTYFSDPLKENYGQPETYEIIQTPSFLNNSDQTRTIIHESRMLVFEGTLTSQRRKNNNNGWSESVFQKINEVLIQFSTGWQSAAHLMQDAAQAVFKLTGLHDMITSGDPNNSSYVQKRMFTVDYNRSSSRAIIIDSEEEDFTRESYAFSGVPEVLQKFMLRLAAAADVPVSLLMGQSPAGLNATGESDIKSFYDRVQAMQQKILKPQLEKLVKYCFLASEGPSNGVIPENWAIDFPSPWQMTEKELAEIRKLQADTDSAYIDRGVVTAEEVAISRFSHPSFNSETIINLDIREELAEENARDMVENQNNTEETPDNNLQNE